MKTQVLTVGEFRDYVAIHWPTSNIFEVKFQIKNLVKTQLGGLG